MNEIMDIFSPGNDLAKIDDTQLLRTIPYCQVFLAEQPQLIARILELLPPDVGNDLLGKLLSWSTTSHHPDAHSRIKSLQGLVDAAEQSGRLPELTRLMAKQSENYNGFMNLSAAGDNERFSRVANAGLEAGVLTTQGRGGLELTNAIEEAIKAGHVDIIQTGLNLIRRQNKAMPWGWFLRAAVEHNNFALANELIAELRQQGKLADLLMYHSYGPYHIFRHGIEKEDQRWMGMGALLVQELSALPDDTLSSGYPDTSHGPLTIKEMLSDLRYKYVPYAPEATQITLENLLFYFNPNTGRTPLSNTGVALSVENPTIFEYLQNLVGEDQRAQFEDEVVNAASWVRGLDRLNSFVEVRAAVLQRQPQPKPARNIAAIAALPTTQKEALPDDFNRALYEELLPIMEALNEAGSGNSNPQEWARKLAILFDGRSEVFSFLHNSVRWAAQNSRTNVSVLREQLYSGVFFWPSHHDSYTLLQPELCPALLDAVKLPPKSFQITQWRSLILMEPEAVRYLEVANDLEAFLERKGRNFPATLDDLRSDIVELITDRYGITCIKPSDVGSRPASATEVTSIDAKVPLKLALVFPVALESEQELRDFDALATTGILGSSVRPPSYIHNLPIDEGTDNYGKPHTACVVIDRITGEARRRVPADDAAGIKYQEWRSEWVNIVFDKNRPQDVLKLAEVLRNMGAVYLHSSDGRSEVKTYISLDGLPDDYVLDLKKRILFNLANAGIAIEEIFRGNYVMKHNITTGVITRKRIRDQHPETMEEALERVRFAKTQDDFPELLPIASGVVEFGLDDITVITPLEDLSADSVRASLKWIDNILNASPTGPNRVAPEIVVEKPALPAVPEPSADDAASGSRKGASTDGFSAREKKKLKQMDALLRAGTGVRLRSLGGKGYRKSLLKGPP